MNTKIVPLAGAAVMGPLGLAHLPRMWMKATLNASGLLADDYMTGNYGFDKMVSEAIGLDPEATIAYLDTLPDYPAYESFVSTTATKLDGASIAAWNEKVRTYNKPPDKAAATRAFVGLDDETVLQSAILNSLDDMQIVYDDVMGRVKRKEKPHKIIPAVSLTAAGPLGVRHLPRLWMKGFLKATGALPDDFNSGAVGFDEFALTNLGLDMNASIAFIGTLPTYMRYETWVCEQLGNLDAKRLERYNDAIMTREKPEDRAAAERAELGLKGTERRNIVLNDLMDWKLLHETMVGARDSQRSPA